MGRQNISPIEMFPCGTRVHPKQLNVHGLITCAANRFDKVTYEVTYYISGEQRTVWMHESEFSTNAKKKPIGFK